MKGTCLSLRVVLILVSGILCIPDSGRGQGGPAVPIDKAVAGRAVESRADFRDVARLDGTIVLDIRYATENNFTHKAVYPVARCLLRADVADRLVRVHQALRSKGMGLKVYDCYRPLSVQKKFWAILPDERYVADPSKGSRHNRGAAVDVGLVDAAGNALEMPSEYDDFSEKAHRDYQAAPEAALKNRGILEEAMKKEGFVPLPTEWWHFDGPGWEAYPVSDFQLDGSEDWIRSILSGLSLKFDGAKQAIMVINTDAASSTAKVYAFEEQGAGWRMIYPPINVTIGKNGFAAISKKERETARHLQEFIP